MALTGDRGERRIALAAVAGAHGVKGEVRLKLFSDSVDSLSRHEKLYVGGVERRLLAVRDGGKTAVARFEGIADRIGRRGAARLAGRDRPRRRCRRSRRANIITPT